MIAARHAIITLPGGRTLMPLADFHADSVAFVCSKDEGGNIVPFGTAFLVGISAGSDIHWPYFVTAKHLIAERADPISMRLRRLDGSLPLDREVSGWKPHPEADVAVAPCEVDLRGLAGSVIQESLFRDRYRRERHEIIRGDLVHFAPVAGRVDGRAMCSHAAHRSHRGPRSREHQAQGSQYAIHGACGTSDRRSLARRIQRFSLLCGTGDDHLHG